MPSPAQIAANRARGYPDWYTDTDEPAAQTPAAASAQPPVAADPSWDRYDPAPAASARSRPAALPDNFKPDGVPPAGWAAAQPGAPRPGMPQAKALPDNFVPDGFGPAQVQANRTRGLPDWYTEDPRAKESWDKFDPPPSNWDTFDPAPDSLAKQASDTAANVATGVLRVPGAVGGLPHLVGHTANWAKAQLYNGLDALTGGPGNHTGAEQDARDPVMRVLPSSQDIDAFVENPSHPKALDWFFNQIEDNSKPAQFYKPQSVAGRLVQAGVTGATSGGGGLANATKNAAATMAAQGTGEVFPDSPALAATAAFLTHAGASGVQAAARSGGGVAADTARQVFQPTKQGKIEAGRVLGKVDNTQPGIETPSDADLSGAAGNVRAVTDDIGPGLPDWQAGAQLRAGLQQRSDALRTARSQAGDVLYDQFRAQAPLPSAALEPLMRAPSFRKAVGAANAAALDEGHEPLTDYWDFDAAGDPVLKPNAAIPPDVLGRVKSWTAAAAANAPAGSAEARTAGILDKRVGSFLDAQYPASGDFPGYGAVRQAYSDAGRPLGDFAHGPVAKALDADRHYGQSRYTLADERVPDLFLRSKATRADLNQLVQASGGDRTAALSALQDHLAGVAQSAVRPDGTLDSAAFGKAMQPYQKALPNLGIWFPELSQKFTNAKTAQATLDNLSAQRGIADAVSGGALRDKDGAVTAASFGKWLRGNGDALATTQSKGALMRLQSIASALQNTRPGELADVLKSEWAPTAAGTMLGGLEGGVLSTLLHKSTKAAFGSLDAKRQAAFSAAIEQAVSDPAYAARLASTAAQRGSGLSPVRALVQAVAVTPLAVNATSTP